MNARQPIIPTRIIPGGAPLPAGPPPPGAVPPWRAPAPAAAAPPPPPPAPPAVPAPPLPPPEQVYVHHVNVHLAPGPYYEPIEPTRWDRVCAWMRTIGRPWQLILALLAALVPIPGVDHSAASIWAYTVGETRAEWGAAYGYTLALAPLAWVVMRTVRHGGTLRRIWAGTVAVIGLIASIDLFDIVTLLTGVTR